ncbi:nucleoside deaminase [Methylacidiphilum caldifontis]|uniref:tRNA-specific adenosine deaminase n=1 Tax=Methylacidiphilum caldifontis TaxID=2795386 RepID=A0A4Y8PE47_9BACT|nr:nucleoside deaminase [Methylacidiphilum caldifontis]QSR88063.1 nucleoside deaminase [Methylacidiphilum caldifontis]TFE69598.1 tRNA-specific adenosine deaminase [Methylacidiphilum caldifontis]
MDNIDDNPIRGNDDHFYWLRLAFKLAQYGSERGEGGPFGAVVVLDGEAIGLAHNEVLSSLDPTAHAEILAIRRAAKKLSSFDLERSIIYTSCEPCPMCFSAIYWAHISKVYYACCKEDAQEIGFQDALLYEELKKPPQQRKLQTIQLLREEGLSILKNWEKSPLKVIY